MLCGLFDGRVVALVRSVVDVEIEIKKVVFLVKMCCGSSEVLDGFLDVWFFNSNLLVF